MNLQTMQLIHLIKTIMITAQESFEVYDLPDVQRGFWRGRFEAANEILKFMQQGQKIHQCHQCNRVLGTELIPCPDCKSGTKEAFRIFELTTGLTKEEADTYGKSVLKLSKPTGINRFNYSPVIYFPFSTKEIDLLNTVLCDAILHHQLGWERYPEGSEESEYHDKARELCTKLFDQLAAYSEGDGE